MSSIVTNPETARVKIGEEASGTAGASDPSPAVDLAKELAPDLEAVRVPDQVDPLVKDALDKLRQGTAKGLSPKDHYDLGVAYMGMGLVDDAVREFIVAKDGKAEGAGKALASAKAKQKAGAKGAAAKGKPKAAAKTAKAAKTARTAKKAAAGKARAAKVKAAGRAKRPAPRK